MHVLRPIETVYKGYRFRSRLEARWGVFFDALSLQWEYEKEGFELTDGRYLPDFWISTVNMWAEVKPEYQFDKRARNLVLQLASHTGFEVLMLGGTPFNQPYPGITPDGCEYEYCLTNHHDYPQKEHRFFAEPADYEREWDDTEEAVEFARSARFEHGEQGGRRWETMHPSNFTRLG